MTLARAAFSERPVWISLMLVMLGSWLIALSAQVSVPMYPVPMTLQTMAVVLVGLAMGARLGALAVFAYLAQGAMGLPVFSGGAAGPLPLVGPTAGFLWGFVAIAFVAGWLAEHGFGKGLGRVFVAALVSAMLVYVPGVLWLSSLTGMSLDTAVSLGAAPFVLGDVLKAAVAAMIVTGAWSVLGRRPLN